MQYVHTNLVARDWRRLAEFYQTVFGCTPVGPERDLSGGWIARAVAIDPVRIRGIHLRLPGWGDDAPTLEIFQYDPVGHRPPAGANTPGYGHIAFAVNDVAAVAETVCSAGGSTLGERTHREIQGAGRLTFQYLADPEGNIVEIQKWEDP